MFRGQKEVDLNSPRLPVVEQIETEIPQCINILLQEKSSALKLYFSSKESYFLNNYDIIGL